jgi:hypothetical protein
MTTSKKPKNSKKPRFLGFLVAPKNPSKKPPFKGGVVFWRGFVGGNL